MAALEVHKAEARRLAEAALAAQREAIVNADIEDQAVLRCVKGKKLCRAHHCFGCERWLQGFPGIKALAMSHKHAEWQHPPLCRLPFDERKAELQALRDRIKKVATSDFNTQSLSCSEPCKLSSCSPGCL